MLTRKNLMSTRSEDPTAFGMGLAAAGREHSIYLDEALGLPVILRSSDLQVVLRDDATFSTRAFQHGLMKDSLIASGGDAHTRLRKLYNGFFGPQQITRYERDIIGPAVDRVLDDLARVDQPDLIDDFCMRVPQRVVSALFGMNAERIATDDSLIHAMLRAIGRPHDPAAVAVGERAYAELAAELRDIARRELEQPGPTLLGEIAKGLIAIGDGNVEACERVVFQLILGSYETTVWGLASVVASLLHHPDVLARVRDDAELLPSAIEESWRWCCSVVGTARFVEREVTIDGHTLAPGTVVQLALLATNYEPDVFPDPAVFSLGRKAKSMIFGGGRHFCVGSALARMETRVAISRLLARFPGLRMDPERPRPMYMLGPRGGISFGPDHLPACT